MVNKYAQRGVSSQKEDVHNAISQVSKGLFPKAFCKVVPDVLSNNPDDCYIMHADGAGTKSSLAYLYWRETGDLSVWEGIAQFCETMREHGIEIHTTGGETADVGDLVRTVIVDSTLIAKAKRSDIIDNANIAAGQVIVGFASYGQATYESQYNGGMGSNGLTSARHDVFSSHYREQYPESYDHNLPSDVVYCGSKRLTDSVEGSPLDAGKLVLSATRTYAPLVKAIFDACKPAVKGMVHCSGGGQTKVLHFTENVHVIKDNLLPIPPLFQLIKNESGTDWKEMFQVFNMGHRLEIYTDAAAAEQMIEIAKSFNIDAQIVGRVEESSSNKLTISGDFGTLQYP
jgi:phosphoribosylformylglycinamidine cyclo-ligase